MPRFVQVQVAGAIREGTTCSPPRLKLGAREIGAIFQAIANLPFHRTLQDRTVPLHHLHLSRQFSGRSLICPGNTCATKACYAESTNITTYATGCCRHNFFLLGYKLIKKCCFNRVMVLVKITLFTSLHLTVRPQKSSFPRMVFPLRKKNLTTPHMIEPRFLILTTAAMIRRLLADCQGF